MYIIRPQLSNPYVYLNYLLDDHGNASDNALGTNVYQRAEQIISKINGNIYSNTVQENITNAITWLNTIAHQQLQNEQKFVEKKIQMLEQINLEDTKIQQLKMRLNNLLTTYNHGFDYIEFTRLLNEVLDTINNYKARLRTLTKNHQAAVEETKKSLSLYSNLDTEFTNTIKFLTGENKKTNSRFKSLYTIAPEQLSSQIQNLLMNNPAVIQDSRALSAALLKIEMDFRIFLEKNDNLFNPDGHTLEERQNNLQKSIQDFFQQNNTNITKYLTDMKENQDLQKLFFPNSMSWQQFTHLSDKEKKRYQTIDLSNILGHKVAPTVILRSDITPRRIAEVTSQAFKKFDITQTGHFNLGDDALGQVICDINLSSSQQALIKSAFSNSIDAILKQQEQFIEDRQSRITFLSGLEDLNQTTETALSNLDQILKQQNAEGFIIHESTKYYESIEQGMDGVQRKNFSTLGFSGRSMTLLNYIDTMYSLGLDLGIPIDNLYFAGINLAPVSPGAELKATLENIFAIAASIIMFDDMSVIMKEATGQLDFSNLTNLHLYKLQDLYFPASYIIQESANYLNKVHNEFNYPDVQIDVPANAYKAYAQFYSKDKQQQEMNKLAKTEPQERWDALKRAMGSQTKVKIHFFMQFQNFIAQMNK